MLRAARHMATVPSSDAITSAASRRARAAVTPSRRIAAIMMALPVGEHAFGQIKQALLRRFVRLAVLLRRIVDILLDRYREHRTAGLEF